ncbi:bacteriocin immunity protein [Saccharothrix sp. NPDC042600]|uniref:bacteriocin immunity protein n=1 Tax=Saccharothrix TaxID=2071 RepID=UPI0033DF84F4|nr:hypothetical protein GCM10017745_67750 [Saccharothrix mutabilis subsp. capreolus]
MEKLTRAEMIELVGELAAKKIDGDRTEEVVEALRQSTGHPRITDLVFYPDGDGMTPDEVVDQALSYRPFQL